jgi:hypothetical protein
MVAFVGVQIKWDKGGTQPEEDYIVYGKRYENDQRVSGFTYFRESYEQLRE